MSATTMTMQTLTFYRTTIGKKVLMALSGIVLVGFVVGHLIGNLQLYAGPEVINAYAAFLHSKPALLWAVRLVLLGSVVVHIVTAVQLATLKGSARREEYRKRQYKRTNYAARTMYWSGPILLVYIIYHLLHLTLGYSPNDTFVEGDVYNNVVRGFQNSVVSVVYIIGNLALAFHLYHGVWSLLQTLGLRHPRYDRWAHSAARTLGLLVAIGNLSFPIAVMTDMVTPQASTIPANEAEK